MGTQTIPGFKQVPEQYGFHNARPETMNLMWGGRQFTLPPVDAVGPNPVLFEDGTPVPGTVVIADGYTMMATGEFPNGGPYNWSAREAVQMLLGIDHTQKATSQVAKNGISYIPLACTREKYEEIKQDGEARYRESLVEWATDTVHAYEVARSKAKEAGVEARPAGPEFYKATAILQARQKQYQQSIEATAAAIDDDELEFEVYAKAQALRMAGKVAEEESVDKAKLVEKLLEDPKIATAIRRKYQLRKKGYLDPEDPKRGDAPTGFEEPAPEG